jgi:hypothetical protein
VSNLGHRQPAGYGWRLRSLVKGHGGVGKTALSIIFDIFFFDIFTHQNVKLGRYCCAQLSLFSPAQVFVFSIENGAKN